jgi:predicted negative regulator of RcsB-dependent stress response
METYLTEEERVEALKRWWKDNKSSVISGLILGLVVIAGWKMWQAHQLDGQERASLAYHQLTQAAEAKQVDSALKLGDRLIQEHASTTYAEYARLILAKLKVDSGDLEGARLALEEQLSKGKDDVLKSLARLRLGRVLLAKGDIEGGLKSLSGATEKTAGSFLGLYEELRGDLLVAGKRPSEARAAYMKAKELGDPSPLLELKINDLPAGV